MIAVETFYRTGISELLLRSHLNSAFGIGHQRSKCFKTPNDRPKGRSELCFPETLPVDPRTVWRVLRKLSYYWTRT